MWECTHIHTLTRYYTSPPHLNHHTFIYIRTHLTITSPALPNPLPLSTHLTITSPALPNPLPLSTQPTPHHHKPSPTESPPSIHTAHTSPPQAQPSLIPSLYPHSPHLTTTSPALQSPLLSKTSLTLSGYLSAGPMKRTPSLTGPHFPAR